ncbi:DUF5694 domain-containing protein [Luteimonas aquatica]|uniref:DUF5694 domain-containing protein n=1 Tax=Luteimonas aquatica TaxID=450364 RepID=UPI003CE549A9
MMRGLALALCGPGLAWAQVDLSALDGQMAGPRAQVLVLGSVHLSGMPKTFKRESLAPVLDRLAAFRPSVITIEAISGEGCDLVARHPTVYLPEDMARYCGSTAAAAKATGLDIPAAIAEANRTLRDWPQTPAPAQRRHLAAVFLAANDKASALVQWLQLAEAERHAGDGLDAALVATLDKLATQNNENLQIGARLAARLGLQRVFAIDDHTGDAGEVTNEDIYWKTIQQAWESKDPQVLATRKRDEALSRSEDMLALYRFINDPGTMRVMIDSDFGANLRAASPRHFGQIYVAGWETRNLRMVANIRAAFRDAPGARVLSIVGGSHKPWFDSLLGQMQGVDIVDAEEVLK